MHPIYGPFYFISSNMHLSPTCRGIALRSNLIPPSKSKKCCKTFRSTVDLKRCDAYFWDYLRKKNQCLLLLMFTIFYLQWAEVSSLCLISLGCSGWVRGACFPPISSDIMSFTFLWAKSQGLFYLFTCCTEVEWWLLKTTFLYINNIFFSFFFVLSVLIRIALWRSQPLLQLL